MFEKYRVKGLQPIQLREPRASDPTARILQAVSEFGDNPGALRLFQYIPPKLKTGSPLVVLLHGCGQSAEEYARGTGWTALARELGFAVLAPEQARSNNMNGCFNWFQSQDTKRGHGEVASIRAMVDWMIRRHRLDHQRVFITGLSAGGAMTAAMLAAYPEVFSGGAIIAGLPSGAANSMPDALNAMRSAPSRTSKQWGNIVRGGSDHDGRWPTISIWHGNADSVVHSSLGDATLAQWADVHGISLSASKQSKLGRHKRREWAKDGRIVLEMVELAGVGHGAPIGGPTEQRYGEVGPYFLEGDVASTAHIAAFWGFPIEPVVGSSEPVQSGGDNGFAVPDRIKRTIAAALQKAGLAYTL